MSKILKSLAIVSLAVLMFAPAASARGAAVIGKFYPGFYGGWYGPGWWGPWYGYPYGFYPMRNAGTVKIKTDMKDGSVFVDGGYAGLVSKMKKFQLRPGIHDIELRDPSGRTIYQERVNVLLGKTIEIHPDYGRH